MMGTSCCCRSIRGHLRSHGGKGFSTSIRKPKGAMVFGPIVYDVPLLPFEKQLIETVNITEEEYRYFVSEAIRKGKNTACRV